MNVSKIILGCEQLGGKDHGKIDLVKLTKAFRESLNLGISSFDSAGIYNLGKSEKNLSKIFKNDIEKLFIITKGGLNYKFSKGSNRASVYRQFDKDFIKHSIKLSSERLKMKQIPLFLIHYPPLDKKVMIDLCQSLEKFKKEKKILNYGFSNIDYKLFNFAYKEFEIYAIENSLNLFNFKKNILTFKKINPKVKKIAHSVLAQGMLSGNINSNTKFSKSDRRNRMSFFSTAKIRTNYKKILKLKKISINYNVTTAALSLSYILNSKHVDSVIIGIKNVEQLKQNLSCLNFAMEDKIKKKIDDIFIK